MTLNRRLGTTLALAAIMAIGALSAEGALGGAVYDNKVTFEPAQGQNFKGKVSAGHDPCVVGRKVQIYRDNGASNSRIAKTFASESGKYSVKVIGENGEQLFAKIKRYEPPSGGTCLPDKSPKITG